MLCQWPARKAAKVSMSHVSPGLNVSLSQCLARSRVSGLWSYLPSPLAPPARLGRHRRSGNRRADMRHETRDLVGDMRHETRDLPAAPFHAVTFGTLATAIFTASVVCRDARMPRSIMSIIAEGISWHGVVRSRLNMSISSANVFANTWLQFT